jgi:hypothetical protein
VGEAFGVEQTEIDALATLRPDLLGRIVRDAMGPFFDTGLDQRVRMARGAWEHRARQLIEERGPDQLEQMRADAEARLADLQAKVDALNGAMRVDAHNVELPPLPEVPIGETDVDGLPSPLIDSTWDFTEQTRRLISHKNYEEGSA